MEVTCGVLLGLLLLVLPLVLAIVAMQKASTNAERIELLEGEIRGLRDALLTLRRDFRSGATVATPTPDPEPVHPHPEPVTVPEPPPGQPHPTPTPEPEPPAPTPTPEPEPGPPVPLPPPEPPPSYIPPSPMILSAAKSSADEEPSTEPTPPQTTTPPPIAAEPPPPRRPPITPPQVRPSPWAFDWEGLVGVKLFSWIAGIALVLAAVFFLKYSVEHGWIGPPIRATIGLLTGITLLVVCEMRIARGYSFTANAMHGAGIAILYATLFATHALWHLLPSSLVFVLMLLVTAVAVGLSIRRDSVFIALLGMMGGFATPILLSSGENRPYGLFGYLLLLNVGLAWVAYRKRWPVLTIGSLAFTVIYQWGWVRAYLTASQMPLAAAIFIVFAIAGAALLWSRRTDAHRSTFDRLAITSAVLPLLFAVFTAAVPAYGARYNVLFGFLLMIAAGLAAIALMRGYAWLHTLGGVTVVLTFYVWCGISYTSNAWPGILAWVAAFIILYLAVAWRAQLVGSYAVPALFAVFPALVMLEKATAAPAMLFATMFVLLAATAFVAIQKQQGFLYLIAAVVAIATEGIWSSLYLTRERLIPGVLMQAAFALLLLAVPAYARRTGKAIVPRDGVGATIVASLILLIFLTGAPVANASLWGLAIVVTLLVAGAIVEAKLEAKPALAAIAIALGWIVLAAWWNAASVGDILIPALVVTTLLGIVVLLGNVWAARSDQAESFGYAAHLALVGHLFLAYAAAQRGLSIPPWPIFAVLAVLDLAIGLAALYLKRGSLMIGGALASQIVLIAFAAAARVLPWPNVALAGILVVAAWALGWMALSRRIFRFHDESFVGAAIVALFLGHIAAIAAGAWSQTQLFGTLLATHVALAIATYVVAWISRQHVLAVVNVALTAVATVVAIGAQAVWTDWLYFALPFYALAIAYPLLLGKRAERSLLPHAAALLGSVVFFLFLRPALVAAGFGYAIGALPVAQAIVLLIVLWRLLRIEPAGDRELSRLALVAGGALAFITVAIPLQLDRQWITIGWALEGAALVWLFTRIPHRGLLLWAGALLAAVFVRLALNPAILAYQQPSDRAILNWYLYTYLVCAAAFFVAARHLRDPQWGRGLAAAGGTILLFVLLNIEIADYYSTGPTLTFNFLSATLAQDLTYTIGWAIFALAMLVAGIILHSRLARIAALGLLLLTILKCFLHDLARLGGLYRVASLLGLAISLVLVGILLQKFVMSKSTPPVPEEAQ